MMKKRSLLKATMIAALYCMMLISLTACAAPESAKETAASVKIINGTEILLDETVAVKKDAPTAQDALVQACQSKKLAYQNKNGLFDGFGGVESTQEDGWLFYFNGELPEKGVADVLLEDNGENLIEMKFVNYSEAFKQ